MKIFLIGNVSGQLDEGMKNSTFNLFNELKKKIEIKLENPRELINPRTLVSFIKFKPDVVHYTMGPTFKSFLLLKFLEILLKNGKYIVSAPRPQVKPWQINLLLGFRPSLVLIQSDEHNKYFKKHGFTTQFFPPGVDTNKFLPANTYKKNDLKKQLDLPGNKKIALHVGQITKIRELEKLIAVQKLSGYQVLIIGASSIPADEALRTELTDAGIIIIEEYIKNLEQYYQIADAFIFPGTKSSVNSEASAIELPLSIFEALSCDIPVISGKFGGIPSLFKEDDHFMYANSSEEIIKCLSKLEYTTSEIKNRDKVLEYSWENLADNLIGIYHNLTITKLQ